MCNCSVFELVVSMNPTGVAESFEFFASVFISTHS